MTDKQYRKFLKRATEDKDIHLYVGESSDQRLVAKVDTFDEPDANGNSKLTQALAMAMINTPQIMELVENARKVVKWYFESKAVFKKGGEA